MEEKDLTSHLAFGEDILPSVLRYLTPQEIKTTLLVNSHFFESGYRTIYREHQKRYPQSKLTYEAFKAFCAFLNTEYPLIKTLIFSLGGKLPVFLYREFFLITGKMDSFLKKDEQGILTLIHSIELNKEDKFSVEKILLNIKNAAPEGSVLIKSLAALYLFLQHSLISIDSLVVLDHFDPAFEKLFDIQGLIFLTHPDCKLDSLRVTSHLTTLLSDKGLLLLGHYLHLNSYLSLDNLNALPVSFLRNLLKAEKEESQWVNSIENELILKNTLFLFKPILIRYFRFPKIRFTTKRFVR